MLLRNSTEIKKVVVKPNYPHYVGKFFIEQTRIGHSLWSAKAAFSVSTQRRGSEVARYKQYSEGSIRKGWN